jgi:hypothetical protein
MERINITVTPGVLARLKKLAECHATTVSGWIRRQAIEAEIPEQCGEVWNESGRQVGQPAVRKSATKRK